MTWTLDRDTDVGRVRVLVTGESTEATAVFADEDIEVFLDIEATVLEASALALERIAGDQALLLRKVRNADDDADNLLGGVMDLTVGTIKLNAAGAAEAFLKLAARYLAAAQEGTAGAEQDFGWAESVYNERGWSDAILNAALRGDL